MYKLSFITLLTLFVAVNVFSQSSPHGGKLNIKCDNCHVSKSWTIIVIKKDSFNHNKTSFPLVGQHQTISCKKCHSDLIFENAKNKTECISCHQDVHQLTLGKDCGRCHTPTIWTVKNITQIHNQSRFPLRGRHASLDCLLCHKSASLLRFDPMGTECIDCHATDYFATTNPSHVTSKFPKDCSQCHKDDNWHSATFNHNNTRFPLTGGHIGVDCIKCHVNGYVGTPTTCASCHLANYNSATTPNHTTNNFSKDCQICHNNLAWQPSTFNHNTTTFPLTGAHVSVACGSCHTNGYNGGTPTTCVGCHLTNYNATTNPNHILAKFSTDCQTCHNVTAWSPSTFNHNTATTFPLTGAHIGVTCVSCHPTGYSAIPTTCVSCHLANYNSATTPNHTTNNFSKDCQICHNNVAWQPSTFNHNTTTFPLTGAHVSVACGSCHTNGYTGGTPTTCVGCHLANYNSATTPNHTTNNFSKDCQICHNNVAWQPSTFNHNTTTFPLTGAHVSVACGSCHTNGYTGGTPTTCVGCHLANYNSATTPNHTTNNFSKDCQICHNNVAWQPSTFNHNTTTFPLTGAHLSVACGSCHTNGYTGGTPTTCVGCHLTNFNASTNPNHTLAKFSTDCQTCHNVTAWSPSSFNHNTATTFPLAGAHIGVTCAACHTNGYAGIPTTCVSCHLTNYNATTNPNHITANFPKTCETCHSTTNWTSSTFNHSTSTTFPLTGAHITVSCNLCHPTNYNAIPTTCVSCHLANYNATTNPNHVTAKFPTSCETCHSTTNWTSSTFNHSTSTTFPLTGAHIGLACNLCHPSNYNAIPTTCVSCHLATYNAAVNPNHIGAKFATTCETCHSTTNWTTAIYDHNTVATIPLTGNHNLSCSTCHTTPTNYTIFSCRQVGCHATAHNAAQGSIGCYQCHPRGRAG